MRYRKSEVWIHCEHMTEAEPQFNKRVVMCNYCERKLSISDGCTSTLWTHLRTIHKIFPSNKKDLRKGSARRGVTQSASKDVQRLQPASTPAISQWSSAVSRMESPDLKNWIKSREREEEELCLMYDMVFVVNKDLVGNWLLKAFQKKLDMSEEFPLRVSKIKMNKMLYTLRQAQDRLYRLKLKTRRFSQCGLTDEVQAPKYHECQNCNQRFDTRIAEQYHKCNGGPCKNSKQPSNSLKVNQGVKSKEYAHPCHWLTCNQGFETRKEWKDHVIEHRNQPPKTSNQSFENKTGVKSKEYAHPCHWINCNQGFETRKEWKDHVMEHRNQPPKTLNQSFENKAGVANKGKTRKRQLSSGSSSCTSDEEFNPAIWRQQTQSKKKKVKSFTKKQGNHSRHESETEFQSETVCDADDEMTNFVSGTTTPSHGYTLRGRIDGSSRPTSPWLIKTRTRNAPSGFSCPTSPHILNNLKLRVEDAVAKEKRNHLVSLWDYTYFEKTRKHLVESVLQMSKHNFANKYNKHIAEFLYGPCKHLGELKKFERRCFWLHKKFFESVQQFQTSDDESDGGGAFSDCPGEQQNLQSQNNPKDGEEGNIADHESVDLVSDADASDYEGDSESPSQSLSQHEAPYMMEPRVRLETLHNGMEQRVSPIRILTNKVVASNTPIIKHVTKVYTNKKSTNTEKYFSLHNTQEETAKIQKPSTTAENADQQKDYLIDESTADTLDFSLQVSDPEENNQLLTTRLAEFK